MEYIRYTSKDVVATTMDSGAFEGDTRFILGALELDEDEEVASLTDLEEFMSDTKELVHPDKAKVLTLEEEWDEFGDNLERYTISVAIGDLEYLVDPSKALSVVWEHSVREILELGNLEGIYHTEHLQKNLDLLKALYNLRSRE